MRRAKEVALEKWLRSDGAPTEVTFAELAKYADIYDEIERHPADGFEGRFLYRMKVMDTATPMPLLLFLYGLEEQTLSVGRRIRAVRAIDSYLVRRATLNLSNRDYNNVFRELVEAASHRPQQADDAVIEALAAMTGQHRFWPSDADFRAFFEREPIYTYLYRRQVRILLEALEHALRTDHTEQLVVPNGDHLGAKLTIEHIMPQSWAENWPMPDDGSEADIDRDVLVHTLGNLTLATARLNPTIGNMGWEEKRSWLGRHSLLRLTHGTVSECAAFVARPAVGRRLGAETDPGAWALPCFPRHRDLAVTGPTALRPARRRVGRLRAGRRTGEGGRSSRDSQRLVRISDS
ncbi:HNH endonuclease family protein [Streptomyces sp900116325]|uniref:HNH endonuclease family protein n=1 Tax=Streptomyces sp. 900116325 TaxID=3154295 RepID=A0ABV2UJ80_9ACTN